MTQITDLLSTFYHNGALVTHQETDKSIGLKHTYCSTFIKKRNLLVKGECDNPKSSQRNAMIVLYDPKTGQFKGIYEFVCLFVLTRRPRVDVKLKICFVCVPLRARRRDLFVCLGGCWKCGYFSTQRLRRG